MEQEVAVLYKGALAQYKVVQGAAQELFATLQHYKGAGEDYPPSVIRFKKDGRHCTGTGEQDLMDDLFHALHNEQVRKAGSFE